MEVLQRTANRGSISTGYDIDNSCKFESDGNEYIDRPVGGSDGSSTQHTISCWIKRTELGIDSEPVSAAGIGRFRFESNDTFSYQFRSGKEIITNRVFRDTSAWYHIVAVADSSQSTASNRMKLYVNGVQETSFGTATYQDQNQAAPGWGKYSTYNFTVGAATNATRNFNGYLAEVYYIDGQVLDPTYFGEYDDDSGIWKPKAFSGTFGSLDTYLDFSNASDLGENSGGTTDLNENSVDSSNQATDTPTNNFAIYNQLIPKDEFIIYQGGTRSKKTTTNRWRTMASTLAIANGKWYAEFQNSLYAATGTARFVGVAPASIFTETSAATGGYLGGNSTETTDSIGYHSDNGQRYINGSGAAYGGSWTTDGIIGVALDMDNGYVYFSKNGTWQNSGDPTSGSSGTGGIALQLSDEAHYIAGSIYNSNAQLEVNYGGFTVISIASGNSDANGYGTFEYAPPSGFYALCTKNLAEYG